MNVALIGSNFALKGYFPVINKIKNLKLKILCSRNILHISKNIKNTNGILFENNWKNVFKKNIDLIILAVPPVVQDKILRYNFKFKKKVIFEKPITQNFNRSKNIIKNLKEKKIKSDINLTFLNHDLFKQIRDIIKKKKLGSVINYKILWNFKSYDLFNKIKSWKTDESQGGGIKNIFLTHVFSYCEFFFGKNKIIKYKFNTYNFKSIKYKKIINCKLVNKDGTIGEILLHTKKSGKQKHKITIKFENGEIQLFTKSKDWTKDFVLKIRNNKSRKQKIFKQKNINKFTDGRSNQIFVMLKNFIKKSNFSNINYCLNAEKMNKIIN